MIWVGIGIGLLGGGALVFGWFVWSLRSLTGNILNKWFDQHAARRRESNATPPK